MSIELDFGSDADTDTFRNVFGHLARGYVVEVNGIDMVVTTTEGMEVGLYGYRYDPDRDDGIEFDPDHPMGFEWGEIKKVVIW